MMTYVRFATVVMVLGASAALTGCLSIGGPDSQQRAIQKEVVELLKSYRMCLQKNEESPDKARENCGVYRDAIRELAPPEQKHSIGVFLERLLSKESK